MKESSGLNILFRNLLDKSRRELYNRFIKYMNPQPQDIILDIGGAMQSGIPCFEKICSFKETICINIDIKELSGLKDIDRVSLILADGCHLPFKNKAIDIVLSNAVIEHVGNFDNQELFASELMRVAKKWFVSTPNFWFPFEPHWKLPFVHFLPKKIQRIIVESQKKSYSKSASDSPRIHLLSVRSLKKLFPVSKITKQRISFYPEVLIVHSDINHNSK